MEASRHTRRPWPERSLSAAPLLCPALAMLFACMAADGSCWWWFACALFVGLPCLIRSFAMSLLGFSLALWAGGFLLVYEHRYRQHSMAGEERVETAGSVHAVSGKSALFRRDGSPWYETVTCKEGECPLQEGRRYLVTGTPYPLSPATGPGVFDRARWGYLNRIDSGISLERFVPLGEGDWKSRFPALSRQLREQAGALLKQGAPPGDEARQVMVAAVLGDKTDADRDVIDRFLMSGCMHVFAVSGMHVGLVAVLMLAVMRLLRVHPRTARLVCLPLLALYVFVTGMAAPALRALVMAAVWMLAPFLRRKGNAANILALAFIILCGFDPLQIFLPGFQLSFCVFTIIVCSVQWLAREKPLWSPDPFIPHRIYNFRERKLVAAEKAIRGALVVSTAAWLVSIPLTAWHFGSWNLYSVAANLGLALLIPAMMGISLAGLALAWWPWALHTCNTLAAWLSAGMLAVTQTVADLPASYLPASRPATDNEALVVPLSRDGWSVTVANPGMVVDAGTEADVRYTLLPVLKARGFQPSGVVRTRRSKREAEGPAALTAAFPGMRNWGITGTAETPAKWIFQPGNELAGTNLPPPLRTGVHQDFCPVLEWNCRGRRVLLIGNAGFSSLARATHVPKADVLVIGRHPRDPVNDMEWIRATGARTVIFTTRETCPVPEGVTACHLPETGTLYLKAEKDGVTVTPWKGTARRTG